MAASWEGAVRNLGISFGFAFCFLYLFVVFLDFLEDKVFTLASRLTFDDQGVLFLTSVH